MNKIVKILLAITIVISFSSTSYAETVQRGKLDISFKARVVSKILG